MIWNIEKNLFASPNHLVSSSMIVVVLLASSVSAAKRIPAFEQKLQRKVSVRWQDQQLAVGLDRLASVGQINIWLDRRVDRQQIVTMQCVDLPLIQALEKMARQQALGFAQLENIVYFGPQQAALELTTLIRQARDSVAKLPTSLRKRWLRAETTTWPRLSEPRTLAESWVHEANLQLIGSEQITHDLWPEQSLPPLVLVDRLVLLLAGFDLTCEIDSDRKSCKIVPITRPLRIRPPKRARYRPSPSSKRTTHQLFTLRLENQPLGRVLEQFAQQLQLEVVWARELKKAARERLISCDVQNVGLDELLQTLLKPAGLQHQLEGKRVTIRAKPE